MTKEELEVPMISNGNSRRGDDRRYHTKKCQALRAAKNTRPASSVELELHEECAFCQGQDVNRSPDFSYQQALREAAQD